jgi:tubulin monoglycylase TTLL3/8
MIKNEEDVSKSSKNYNDDILISNSNPRSKEVKSLNSNNYTPINYNYNLESKIRAKSLNVKIKKCENKKEKEKEKEKTENDPIYKENCNVLIQRSKENFPQTDMNGDRNIWIIKPSGLSRGRGIKCADNLEEILSQMKSGANQFIIQKYIENPLIINKRKV